VLQEEAPLILAFEKGRRRSANREGSSKRGDGKRETTVGAGHPNRQEGGCTKSRHVGTKTKGRKRQGKSNYRGSENLKVVVLWICKKSRFQGPGENHHAKRHWKREGGRGKSWNTDG